MHIKYCKLFFTILCVILLLCTFANAEDRGLSLLSSEGSNTITVSGGAPITVQVMLDVATNVAGASFTITYDTANLTLDSVTSDFFQTFVLQLDPDPAPACVTLDKEYCSPIVDNVSTVPLTGSVTTGSLIAAARVDKGTGNDIPIFTLNFSLNTGGETGVYYPINIIQSRVTNPAAGYVTETAIPFLVGIDDSGADLAFIEYNVPTPEGCIVSFDMDNDNIPDAWEIANRPVNVAPDDPNVLTHFNKKGDYDRDGYLDYQEYLNDFNGEKDPLGADYKPTIRNAPKGTGYQSRTVFLPAVYPLLLD